MDGRMNERMNKSVSSLCTVMEYTFSMGIDYFWNLTAIGRLNHVRSPGGVPPTPRWFRLVTYVLHPTNLHLIIHRLV